MTSGANGSFAAIVVPHLFLRTLPIRILMAAVCGMCPSPAPFVIGGTRD